MEGGVEMAEGVKAGLVKAAKGRAAAGWAAAGWAVAGRVREMAEPDWVEVEEAVSGWAVAGWGGWAEMEVGMGGCTQ